METEQITWVMDERLPDSDRLVLIEVPDFDSSGQVAQHKVDTGYLVDGKWRASDAWPLDVVVAWAELPKGSRAA